MKIQLVQLPNGRFAIRRRSWGLGNGLWPVLEYRFLSATDPTKAMAAGELHWWSACSLMYDGDVIGWVSFDSVFAATQAIDKLRQLGIGLSWRERRAHRRAQLGTVVWSDVFKPTKEPAP